MARKVLRRALDAPQHVIINTHWRRYGIGRMYAGPWASLASMDRHSRAVALIGAALLDVDFNNAHPRYISFFFSVCSCLEFCFFVFLKSYNFEIYN